MQAAVQAAPPVWAMTDELLQDAPDMKEELSELLAKAKDITGKLRDSIRAVENGDAPADRKMLRDDAHVFVNVSPISYTCKVLLLRDYLDRGATDDRSPGPRHITPAVISPPSKHGPALQCRPGVRHATACLLLLSHSTAVLPDGGPAAHAAAG